MQAYVAAYRISMQLAWWPGPRIVKGFAAHDAPKGRPPSALQAYRQGGVHAHPEGKPPFRDSAEREPGKAPEEQG